MTETVLTDGWNCFVRLRRGVYAEVDRRGRRKGGISTDFQPRPRWRAAWRCKYEARATLWCERCGAYDLQYAESGVRSYYRIQSRKAAK